jgi:hypothetical protein
VDGIDAGLEFVMLGDDSDGVCETLERLVSGLVWFSEGLFVAEQCHKDITIPIQRKKYEHTFWFSRKACQQKGMRRSYFEPGRRDALCCCLSTGSTRQQI